MATQEQANRTLAAHVDTLIAHPNVTSVSVIEEEDGENIIEIGMVGPEYGPLAMNAGPLPDELVIPDESGRLVLGGATIPVRKRIVGKVSGISFTDRVRPAHGGDSCGPAVTKSAGTLGARVDRSGTPCILSAWHVLYEGVATNGTTIVQPGTYDGGSAPKDAIGTNLRGVLSDTLDAAIATIDKPEGDFVEKGTRCYGAISGVDTAAVKMAVKKCGRSTGATSGTVTSVNSTVKVTHPSYPGGEKVFKNQIQMTLKAIAGDSGAVVLTDKNAAVGLLFAASTTDGWANHIQDVMKTFGVTFA